MIVGVGLGEFLRFGDPTDNLNFWHNNLLFFRDRSGFRLRLRVETYHQLVLGRVQVVEYLLRLDQLERLRPVVLLPPVCSHSYFNRKIIIKTMLLII